MSDFDRCLAFVLAQEGGRVDDAADLGGRTNQGITQRTFTRWLEDRDAPSRDVFTISNEDVGDIYCDYYWNPGCCDAMSWPMNLVHFDTCVLFGVPHARKFQQFAADAEDYIYMRRKYHRKVAALAPSQQKFLNGWLARCDRLEVECSLPS